MTSPPLIVGVSGEPEDGKVYLFSVDGDLYLKRAEWQDDGSLYLVSDNKAPGFVPIRVAKDDLATMKVLGQASGSCMRCKIGIDSRLLSRTK